MKKTELIFVITWITFFLLKGVDYTKGEPTLLVMATLALSLFYLFGASKLFKPADHSQMVIPILAGIALATSLITIPFNIFLRNWDWLQILPYINIVFTCFLIGKIGLRKFQTAKAEKYLKPILLRTSLVMIIGYSGRC